MNSCFEIDSCCTTKRIHLPVANRCYANCYYCQFSQNNNISNQQMPGHSRMIIYGRYEMEQYLEKRIRLLPDCEILGVSGPGDILSSHEQLATLIDFVNNSAYSKIPFCICTNGWDFLFTKSLLNRWHSLSFVTLTINSLDPNICAKIYRHPHEKMQYYQEKIDAQLDMLKWAAEKGLLIKINTVLSDYNAESIFPMWLELQKLVPIKIFNLLQMDGQNIMTKERKLYLSRSYDFIMSQTEEYEIPVKQNCRHCRADSFGRW